MRTFDTDVIETATDEYKSRLHGFDVRDWTDDDRNIALTNPRGDVALFEYDRPHVMTGHYFFHSRGRQALKAAREFLDEFFSGYDVKLIRGMTPLYNLGALWMNKQLGFKSYGVVDTIAGKCELVMLTRDEYERNKE